MQSTKQTGKNQAVQEEVSQAQELTLEDVVRSAQEMLLRQDNHPPTGLAEGSLQAVVFQFGEFGKTVMERARLMFEAGLGLAQSQQIGELRQVFFIMEGWMSGPGQGQRPILPPSQDPRRKEVLIISSFTVQSRRTRVVVFEVRRDKHRRVISPREFDPNISKDAAVESPLLAAFVAGFEVGSKK